YTVRIIDGLHERMEQGADRDTTLDMLPRDVETYDNVFTALDTHGLKQRIAKEETRGTGMMTDLLLAKHKRHMGPSCRYLLTLMGVSLSSKKVRGGIGLSLGIGIALSFTFLVLVQFSTMFSLKGGLPPLIAILIPNILFLILALWLKYKAPK